MADNINIGLMTLNRYFNQHPRSLKPHEREGRREGKNNKPPSDSESFSGYELQLIAKAKNSWAKYQQHKKQQILDVRGKITNEEDKRDDQHVQNIENLQNKQEQELNALTNIDGPQSPRQLQLKRDYDNVSKRKKF